MLICTAVEQGGAKQSARFCSCEEGYWRSVPQPSRARSGAECRFDIDLEADIAKLEATPNPSQSDAARLKELRTELEKINKKKEDYVAEHPEHRKLVFRAKRQQRDTEQEEAQPKPKARKLFDKNGLPRHPERSVYYDPVMNPYGVPPPGMPYIERRECASDCHRHTTHKGCLFVALRPDEVDSDQDDERAESDDDIPLPAGPPPGQSEENEENSDDDIPMPEGPPPPKSGVSTGTALRLHCPC